MNDLIGKMEQLAGVLGMCTGRRRALGLLLLVPAIASSIFGLVLFTLDEGVRYAWTFYLAGLVLFLAALDMLFGEPDRDTRSLPFSRSLVLPGIYW